MSDHVAPDRLRQMVFGFAPPLLIEAGVRTGVFDTLEQGPLDLAALASATGTSHRGMGALANALVGLGLLAKAADDRYELTPESAAFLVRSKPEVNVGGLFAHASTQLIPAWLHIVEAVTTGRPPIAINRETGGAEFFAAFVEALLPMGWFGARALAGHLAESGSAPVRILDIAAGSGVWSIPSAQRFPDTRVVAVDWPDVLAVTRRVVERYGLVDRYELRAGDIGTADFGTGYSLAVLGQILHSEGEERGRALLRKVFDALAPGGTVAIAEFLVDPDRRGPPLGLIFAVNMLINTDHGSTWSAAEIGGWLREAGFTDVRSLAVPAPSPLILATKPG
ncbi:MAG TPA: methyltransferase [Stellaceae bacterium]|nr:methyltransferase [Stellaceae bacterium]